MTLTSRAYTDDDLPILQAALAGWVQEGGDCGYCHALDLPQMIYKGLHHKPIYDLVKIWEDESGIMGITINYRFDNAFEVYTKPAYRGTETEIQMIEDSATTTLKFMQEAASKETSVIVDVWQCDETRKKILEQIGFHYYRDWGPFQERRLSEPIPAPILPYGYTVRSILLDEYAQYMAAYNTAFDIEWSPEDYRDTVMTRPGYDMEHHIAVVAPDGKFAAVTILWFDEVNKLGLFEPVATHRDFHRQGMGRALMLYCLQKMKKMGMERAFVGHDATNIGAEKLYNSVGFSIKYKSVGYKRT